MPINRVKIETFQAVIGPGSRGLRVARGLQLVRAYSDTDVGYIDPSRIFDPDLPEPDNVVRFASLPITHRRLKMEWRGGRRGEKERRLDSFSINVKAAELPQHVGRYKMLPSDPEASPQGALVSIVNFHTKLFEGQRAANQDGRRIDLFKAGRRAGDPLVDLVFLAHDEEAYVVKTDELEPFRLTALKYQTDYEKGLKIDEFGPTAEDLGDSTPEPPDRPHPPRGGPDRSPTIPLAPLREAGAAAEPERELEFEVHPPRLI
ncbi:hypothetical protein A3F65_03390 [Candidatus Saccharibacteria bacterium RIFCSPHIGHO2_12_FULL_47_16b]|nr:MAG: hypothetical protein A3F65_03390 [Candidatus Saccharibacteria bacterium RIFCSPHIGHO2_12_FULL_47_16b]OGL38773.1 MAG: hypothetical protein A3J32_02860 [Candidatus Saccharibacteria bacterium RIFCSPLOWO2_02_FULL_46_7]